MSFGSDRARQTSSGIEASLLAACVRENEVPTREREYPGLDFPRPHHRTADDSEDDSRCEGSFVLFKFRNARVSSFVYSSE